MGTILLFAVSLCLGYYLFLIFSHPAKKKNKLPKIYYKNFEFLPNVRIHVKNKTYHLHHWFVLSVVTVGMLYVFDSFQHFMVVKGVAIGGILQGLRYPDRFKFRHPRLANVHASRKSR